MAEEFEGLTPLPWESALILGGPDDSVFDDIFDWIANGVQSVVTTVTSWVSWAVSSITDTVTSWFTWLWQSVSNLFSGVWDWFSWLYNQIASWVTTQVSQVWGWITWAVNSITGTVTAWFSEQWSRISALFSNWISTVNQLFTDLWTGIQGGFTSLWGQLDSLFASWGQWIVDRVTIPISEWWEEFLDKLFDFPTWVGKLFDTVWSWLSEEVPGSSPRGEGIIMSIMGWFRKWFIEFPMWMAEDLPARAAYGLSESFKWIGEVFNSVFESFTEAMLGLIRQIGPISPDTAVGNYTSIAKVGMIALGGLAGMTVAGEFLNPISHLGLGHVSAMIYDMTNYKMITGVFMGAVTATMLRTPLTYYFNDLFRPWLLRPGDFMELMARNAFIDPEKLRVPELTETVAAVCGGSGAGFESRMIGYYGYPPAYLGFFKELSFAPLRYFPLAGIARAGFWDEDWFMEALSRSGYSPTAKEALMNMYREQVLTARQLPVMAQVRRLARDGFASVEQIKEWLDQAAKLETLTECRMMAMELEQVYARKGMAFDIFLSAFSRGILTETEALKDIQGLDVPTELAELHLLKYKLGLMRRVSLPVAEAVPAMEVIEE